MAALNPDKVITLFLSIALFVLLPFVYSTKLQDVEQGPRFLFLAGIVAVSSILSLIFLVKRSSAIPKDKIYLMISLLLLIQMISFFRSINFGDGLFEFLKLSIFYALFFQWVLLFSIDENNRLVFFKAIGISSLLFLGLGVVQLMPSIKDFIGKGAALKINYAVSSTLGNKNFFAETLLMMFPVTLLSILYHRTFWKGFFIAVSILIFIALAILQTLSTWAALAILAVLLIILLFRFHKKIFTAPEASRYFYMGSVVVLIIALLSGFIFVRIAGTTLIKARITAFQSILTPGEAIPDSLKQNSTYERVSLWKNSIKIIADYPVNGTGLGNWKIISPSYGTGSAKYMTTGVIRFVHPHNDFLLIASESGLVGLVVFLFLLGMLFYYGWSLCAKATDGTPVFFGLAMISGLTGYIVIAFFSLPSTRIYPPLLLMFFAALIVTEYLKSGNSTKLFGTRVIAVILLLSLTASVTSAVIGNIRLKAEFNLSAALLQERKKKFDIMRRQLEKIDRSYYPIDATATPIAWYLGYSNFYLGDREKAFDLFREAAQSNPNHLMVLNDLATSYNLSGDAATAEVLYKKALAIQPQFGDARINLAIIYFNSGQLDKAYETLILYTGRIKGSSVTVFGTILSAKAETYSQNEAIIAIFRENLKSPASLERLLNDIREEKGGLEAILGM